MFEPFRPINAADLKPRMKAKPPYQNGDPVSEKKLPYLDRVIWSGKQWAVTDYGIECIIGATYEIEKARLLEDRDYGWIKHMAEKTWVDLPDFVAAFGVALAAHVHEVGGLK